MRLNCEVRVGIRDAPNLSCRVIRSTLVLSADPGKSVYSILHFSSVNKLGKKYKVSDNIHRVFVKFCNEGKATIQFKVPAHDFYIQGDPVQLKLFLKTLKNCLDGNVDRSDLSSAAVVPKNAAPTKLTILQTSDLPVKGLPRTLNQLQISGLRMCNFKREILSLRSLRTLDLSDNCIEKLPPELGNLPQLTELTLKLNRFGQAENPDWRWIEGPQITNRLKLLDLSDNNLEYKIPQTIFKLKNLVTLKLDNNGLRFLPSGIGTIKTLKYLSAANNKLTSLPGNMLLLHLVQLDLSSNPLTCETTRNINLKFRIKPLVQIASSAVLTFRLPYARNIIPYTLVDDLDNSKHCICGKATFDSLNYVKYVHSLKSICETIISDGKYDSSFDCCLCSYGCYRKYISRKRSRQN